MGAWNFRMIFLVAALQANAGRTTTTIAAAFFSPSTLTKKTNVFLSTPDQWLGSSPSDHYGGAVGPTFDRFDGKEEKKPKAAARRTANIAPLDWNGGTMEAGFSQQIKQQQQQSGKSYFPEKPKENAAFASRADEEMEPQAIERPEVAFQVKNEVGVRLGYATPEEWEQQGRRSGYAISPLEWNGGTMEQGFAKAQKQRPSRYLEAPFESKSIREGPEYATLKQVTPAGKPKMIGYEQPSEKNKLSTPSEDWKQRRGTTTGTTDDSSEGIAPLTWDDGSVKDVILQQQKWIPSGHHKTAFESKPIKESYEYTALRQATPAGQPKMIRPEGSTPRKTETREDVMPQAVANQEILEQQLEDEPVTITPYEQWEQKGEQRLPPAEGFPISEFRSIPDQPGEWFYHDVSTGQPRPAWPGIRQQQKKNSESFQDNGSIERGLGHEQKTKQTSKKDEENKSAEEPYASKKAFEVSPPRQATPPGQPKLIRPETAQQEAKSIGTPASPVQEKKERAVEATRPMFYQQGVESSDDEQRLPPAEGFPISRFHSTPDQPGEWFYHDVSTGQPRPAWPGVRNRQKKYSQSFQDNGSIEKGLGHDASEKP